MEAYAQDLRDRVIATYDEGAHTQAELAEAFRVSLSWVKKLLRRRRETGRYAASPGGRGPAPRLRQAERRVLADLVAQTPDATLAELQAGLRARAGVGASLAVVCRAARAMGLTRKKSPSRRANGSPPSGRASGGRTAGGCAGCRPPTASTSTRPGPTRP